jgi:hypothetical protein
MRTKARQYDEARKAWRAAIELQTSVNLKATWQLNLASLCVQAKMFDEAEKLYVDVIMNSKSAAQRAAANSGLKNLPQKIEPAPKPEAEPAPKPETAPAQPMKVVPKGPTPVPAE